MEPSTIFSMLFARMMRTTRMNLAHAEVALRAQGDQIRAALRDAMQPGSTKSERLIAYSDVYMYATFEMLLEASRSLDRMEFAEAEMKAWAVARALDRAADALAEGDDDTIVAAMMAAETVLGINLTS